MSLLIETQIFQDSVILGSGLFISENPFLLLKNTIKEDSDGGRVSKIIFDGIESGGEEHTLAMIESNHDGVGADQKGNLIFKTNAGTDGDIPTERMRIDSNGRISISPLALGSKISLWTGDEINVYGFGITATQLNYHVNTISDSHVFYAGGSNGDGNFLVKIKGNGCVGIGEINPTKPLHFNNTEENKIGFGNEFSLELGNISGDFGFNLYAAVSAQQIFLHKLFGTNQQAILLCGDATVQNVFGVSTSADYGSNWNPRFVVTQLGYIGIGTATPGSLLEITSENPYLIIKNSTEEDILNGRESQIRFKGITSTSVEHTLALIQIQHTSTNQRADMDIALNFGNDVNNPSTHFLLTWEGRMKLGTSGDPTAAIHINNNYYDNDILLNRVYLASQENAIEFKTSSTFDFKIGQINNSSDFDIYSYGTSSNVIRIKKSSGYVGINTDIPNTTLDVQGGQTGKVTTVNSATYDLINEDYILHVTYTTTGAVTSLTLPTVQTKIGRIIIIKDWAGNAGTNTITIDTEGSQKIDNADTYVINTDYGSVILYCDGANWGSVK